MKVQDVMSAFFAKVEAVDLDSDEVRAMDALICEKRSYEHLVGELSDELKKMLFILDQEKSFLKSQRNAFDEVDLVARVILGDFSVTAEQKEQVVKYRLAEVSHALSWEIFWGEVKLTFSESVIAEAIGVRKGWLLVSFSQVERHMEELLSFIMPDCDKCEQRETCGFGGFTRNPGACNCPDCVAERQRASQPQNPGA